MIEISELQLDLSSILYTGSTGYEIRLSVYQLKLFALTVSLSVVYALIAPCLRGVIAANMEDLKCSRMQCPTTSRQLTSIRFHKVTNFDKPKMSQQHSKLHIKLRYNTEKKDQTGKTPCAEKQTIGGDRPKTILRA